MSEDNSMNNPNCRLLKSGAPAHELTPEERLRGSRSSSLKKRVSSRINGLLTRTDLSDEQRYMLAMLKEHQFVNIITELISMSLENVNDPKQRNLVIDQLTKLIPNKNINFNLDKNSVFDVEAYKKFRDAVYKHCDEQTIEKIENDFYGG